MSSSRSRRRRPRLFGDHQQVIRRQSHQPLLNPLAKLLEAVTLLLGCSSSGIDEIIQVLIGLTDRVVVDLVGASQTSHTGQNFSRLQSPGGDQEYDLLKELFTNGDFTVFDNVNV